MGTLTWDLASQTLTLAKQNESNIVECGVHAYDVSATYGSAMKSFCDSFQLSRPLVHPISQGIAVSELAITLKEIASSPC